MKIIIYFIVSLIVFSCGNTPEESIQKVIPQKINSSIYGNTDFKFPPISVSARAEVIHWGAFEDFEEQAKTINGNNMEAIQTKSILMVSHIDSLIKKIPDTLNTPLIFSRVIVVKTRTQLLNQEVNKAHFDSVRLQDYFKELNISVKNLFFQINDKFEKDAIDLQRVDNEKQELKLQKQFLDSVYKAELEDQKKK
tara:strand:+ start:17620 stop:18204 length:585 start_codon:yes stop_codon:yes gene_type:complete